MSVLDWVLGSRNQISFVTGIPSAEGA
jgi:hypothetical protein